MEYAINYANSANCGGYNGKKSAIHQNTPPPPPRKLNYQMMILVVKFIKRVLSYWDWKKCDTIFLNFLTLPMAFDGKLGLMFRMLIIRHT